MEGVRLLRESGWLGEPSERRGGTCDLAALPPCPECPECAPVFECPVPVLKCPEFAPVFEYPVPVLECPAPIVDLDRSSLGLGSAIGLILGGFVARTACGRRRHDAGERRSAPSRRGGGVVA